MKKYVIVCIFLIFVTVFILPIFLGLCSHSPNPSTALPNTRQKNGSLYIRAFNTDTGKSEYVCLEEYLPGVLAAEMPASFEFEALKAQAVAARSYILSRLNQASDMHPDAAVCNDPNHCKAHISEEEAKSRWAASETDRYWSKIRSAVAETSGEYMVCGEDIVEAFFFAKSGGRTENSEDVWGESRPYLKSVASLEDHKDSDFYSFKELSFADFRTALYPLNHSVLRSTAPPNIGKITRTEGGSVRTISIDGQTFKGTEIRNCFSLKSANFEISLSDNSIIFKVSGYGHGVGMSQSGANQMAQNGKNYTEILSHYYTNIQIMKL